MNISKKAIVSYIIVLLSIAIGLILVLGVLGSRIEPTFKSIVVSTTTP